MNKKNSILIILLLASAGVYAQNFSSIHYSEINGLPSNTVYDITQDKDGFIWFGTENGVSRFDGHQFKNFTTKDGLPDNAVLVVYADKAGRVYFCPFTHSPYYYYKDSIYKLPLPEKIAANLKYLAIFHEWKNDIVVTGTGINIVIRQDNSISELNKYFPNLPPGASVAYLKDSVMIVFDENNLYFRNDKNFICIGKVKDLQKPVRYTNQGVPVLAQKVSSTPLSSIGYLRNDIFCASQDNNAFFFSCKTGQLLYKIKIDKISKSFIDNEDNLWITTLGNGIYRFPSFEFKHTNFDGINEIFAVNNFKGKIIAGSDFSKSYSIDSSGIHTVADYSPYLSQSDNPVAVSTKRNRILKFLPYKENLYIGADAFLLKVSSSSAIRLSPAFPVKDIDTSEGKLLLCTGKNAFLVDGNDLSIKDTLLQQRSTCGVFYQGDYYIGTIGGLIKINSKTKAITPLGNSYPLLKNRITAVKRGTANDLWIASSGSGLIHYKQGKVIHTLNTKAGITSDICTSLFIDSNEIWLGTSKGLNRLIPRGDNWDITSITTANGLAADFINTVYVHNNIVYAGTSAGLSYFNKNTLNEKSICRLHITGISAGNNTLKKDSILSFPHNTLNIKIEFTAVSFKSAGDIRYYHRLKGLEDDWNVTTDNFVNYSTLPPGDYTLLIKAINKFGLESETKTISIRIHPAWWQTWPFWLAVIGLLLLLIALLYRRSIRSIRKKEKLKRETEARFAALEQQALQAQMNPHFIFNSLNSIQSFILDLDVEGANKYLTTFASLIRQTLDNSSSLLISLSSELKYLDTYLQLEKLRFKDKFNYTIQTDDEINQQTTLIPGMLLQPYVENSLRHGIQHRKDNHGVISIDVTSTTTGGITYTIKDNGVGRKKSEELKSRKHIEYQSKGTAISLKRINAINNQFGTNIRVNTDDITGTNDVVEGTIVTLFIPHLNKPVL